VSGKVGLGKDLYTVREEGDVIGLKNKRGLVFEVGRKGDMFGYNLFL